LGDLSTNLREKLGESLATVQKYDAPMEQVTTGSLEALQAYSLGLKTWFSKGVEEVVPFFKRAVELDPTFSMAYARLGTAYSNLGETALASKATSRAYQLRDRASAREKLYIESHYHELVTGDEEMAAQVYGLWKHIYPRDMIPYGNLGGIYSSLGRHQEALEQYRAALDVEPSHILNYANLAVEYLLLGRTDDCKAMLDQVAARKVGNFAVIRVAYLLAFLQGDFSEMQRQQEAGINQPEVEGDLLALQADTEAFYGRLTKAREFTHLAIESAHHAGDEERAAGYQVIAALRETDFGNELQGRRDVAAALARSPTPSIQTLAALALARSGDTAQALRTAGELARQSPSGTLLNRYWLPTIHAAVAARRQHPEKAIENLLPVAPCELANPQVVGALLYPVYERGEAYLQAQSGAQATAEFQKILDHPSLTLNYPVGALAKLGRARALTLSDSGPRSRQAYEEFFALWRDADSDIPILKQAKTEYAKLPQ